MPYPRWTSGKRPRLSAGGWNAAMASAEGYEQQLRSRGVAGADAAGLNRTVIQVKNATSNSAQRGHILGLGDWTFDPDNTQQLEELQETLCVEGVVPAAATHKDQFVVLPYDLAEGEIGDAILSGLVLVKVDITNTSHTFCTVADGVTQNLKSAAGGRGRILKAQPGTGLKWALVELGGTMGEILIKNDTGSDIAAGSSGTFKVFSGTPGSETDTGQTINAFNKSSVAFKNGKFGAAAYLNGHAYACPWQT